MGPRRTKGPLDRTFLSGSTKPMSSRGGKCHFCLRRASSLVGVAVGSVGEKKSSQSDPLTAKSVRRDRHEPRGSVHTALPII